MPRHSPNITTYTCIKTSHQTYPCYRSLIGLSDLNLCRRINYPLQLKIHINVSQPNKRQSSPFQYIHSPRIRPSTPKILPTMVPIYHLSSPAVAAPISQFNISMTFAFSLASPANRRKITLGFYDPGSPRQGHSLAKATRAFVSGRIGGKLSNFLYCAAESRASSSA